MKVRLVLLFSGLLLSGPVSHAAPLGTAFTYQGRLDNGGTPANGSVPMVFRLFDAESLGNAVGSPLNQSVSAANGLFTVDLNFGATAFNGDARWLEVTANGTLLTPRTRVAPSPHAIYASTAGTVPNGAIQASQLAVAGTPGQGKVLGYNGSSLEWQSSVWALNGSSAYYNGGRVGIGTVSPLKSLQVGDDSVAGSEGMIRFGSRAPTGNSLRSWNIGVPQTGADLSGIGYSFVIDDTYAGTDPEFIIKYGSGNVGIGTANPVGSKLQVVTANGNGVGGYSTSSGASGVYGENNGQGYGVAGRTTGTGVAVYGDNRNPAGWAGAFAGNVLVDGYFLRVNGLGGEQAYLGGDGAGGDVQLGSFNPSVVNVALYNAASGTYMNLGCRDLTTRVLTITGGADIAEPFPMKEEEIEKGSVVVIDEDHPGRLMRSTKAYDTRVAGIISGANGINPGIALKQKGALDQGENVALTGRVYVKADAFHGAIKPGDLLTTSDTPGHAMKVSDHTKSQGAILGKAMSALHESTGLVLVLVTLQ